MKFIFLYLFTTLLHKDSGSLIRIHAVSEWWEILQNRFVNKFRWISLKKLVRCMNLYIQEILERMRTQTQSYWFLYPEVSSVNLSLPIFPETRPLNTMIWVNWATQDCPYHIGSCSRWSSEDIWKFEWPPSMLSVSNVNQFAFIYRAVL